MSVKKYELVMEANSDEVPQDTELDGLFRIRALVNIPEYNVFAGDIGGFVQSYRNLSHDGNCWIAENAIVCGNACITENALIRGNALVDGEAKVSGTACIAEHAHICDGAIVQGDAMIVGSVTVCEDSMVCGNAYLDGTSRICGTTIISIVTKGLYQ